MDKQIYEKYPNKDVLSRLEYKPGQWVGSMRREM